MANVDLGDRQVPRVLVVDQTHGDISILRGLVPPDGFQQMLEAALRENPGAQVIVKSHPDVLSGKKRGSIQLSAVHADVRVIHADVNPIALLEQVDRVYTATSQLGFEALMLGKPVTCFGVPFYAGWGLTDDRVPVPRRVVRRSVEEVFAAAYFQYCRYVNPETGRRCEVEELMEHLVRRRELVLMPKYPLVCFGFNPWKRAYIPQYLKHHASEIRFERQLDETQCRALPQGHRAVVWGLTGNTSGVEECARRGIPVWRMEDGFLRSVGLGADRYPPASLVLDRLGIYYDPTRPSELEQILSESEFDAAELARARRLRESIVSLGISKYNVGDAASELPDVPEGKRVVLVPGQVENDASVRLGCVDVRTNAALLEEVRQARPNAFIIYKPHPDVVSGNRTGAVPRQTLERCTDAVIVDAPLPACLALAHEVHTMTSLVGFEALLRGLEVTVYGLPFYAGWGLTRDRHEHPRRGRALSLDALVAGALIRYPLYLHPETRELTTPEIVVGWLRDQMQSPANRSIRKPWVVRKALKTWNAALGLWQARARKY